MNKLLELGNRKGQLEKKLIDHMSMDSTERDKINAEISELIGKIEAENNLEQARIAEAGKEQSRADHPAKSAKLSSYILTALDPDAKLTGREAELNSEERLDKLDGLWVPAVMLDDPQEEQRADDISPPPSDTAVNSSPILGRVFARSLASYLGCQFPTVPVGTRLWTSLASGSTASTLAAGGSIEADAATWTQITREPGQGIDSYTGSARKSGDHRRNRISLKA